MFLGQILGFGIEIFGVQVGIEVIILRIQKVFLIMEFFFQYFKVMRVLYFVVEYYMQVGINIMV